MATKKPAENKYLLIVSLDAVSDGDAECLTAMPCFGSFCRSGVLVKQVASVFISNTYPVHTSIVTGCHPNRHGITENTVPSPGDMNPDWYWHSGHIRTPTIYTRAADFGYSTASVMWPVTARARIRYNIPEIAANRWWKNQIAVSLANGSPLLQLRAALKFGGELRGLSQPQIDDFSCAALGDIIRRKRPNLSMIHFTDVDSHKHSHGIRSAQAADALKRMDARLAALFSALSDAGIRQRCSVIILGDHSMLDVDKALNFNREFEKRGLLKLDGKGRITSWRAWLKGCGGTAFLYLRDKADAGALAAAGECLQESMDRPCGGVKRFLGEEEMELSGLGRDCPLGVEADAGYEFSEPGRNHRATHGYSLKQENYKTFYAVAGNMVNEGAELSGGCLTDIAPLALRLLDLPGWDMDGSLREGLLK